MTKEEVLQTLQERVELALDRRDRNASTSRLWYYWDGVHAGISGALHAANTLIEAEQGEQS